MTRGNQRELARQKAAKKAEKKTGSDHTANKGVKLNDRKQRDADAMRLKQQKAEEKKAAAAEGGTEKK